jgi:hypothetical protein
MANGEKSGQWGTITNTNLATVLEQAIAGTTTIDITGETSPITLTSNNGSSDQSREAILLVIGTNASNMNIVVPAVSKFYLVNNTSNRSVTIKTSASTGVTIPTNSKQIVAYNTATSDFEAITPLPGGNGTVTSVQVAGGTTGLTFSGGPITSSGTITLAGTLALANGGTGATTQQGAINALLPGQGGQGGKFLTTDGTNVTWATVGGGGGGSVTSVNASGGTTGFTFTGGPITTTGTLTLSGTLAIANGGTGGTTQATARTGLGLGNLATLNAVSLTSNVTGILPAGNGGTGASSYSSGQLLIGNSVGSLTPATLTAGSGISISNGSGAITISATGGSGGGIQNVLYYVSGSTWAVPAGVTKVKVTVVGGGGSGAFPTSTGVTAIGAGGGGGGVSQDLVTVTPGTAIAITVGAGGATPTTVGSNGNSGGSSSFGGVLSATGGQGGRSGGNGSIGGTGGIGSGPGMNIRGQAGGGGGQPDSSASGTGGSTLYGFGGTVGNTTSITTQAGNNYGGGGAGALVRPVIGGSPPGPGASGIVILEY